MARTRKGAASGPKPAESTCIALPEEPDTPPQLFVLPQTSSDARIVTLQNPRHATPSRYLVCPETGIYEFTRIAAPRSSPRSWLVEGAEDGPPGEGTGFGAHVVKNADLYVASPMDPLFLALPALVATGPSRSDPPRRMFLSTDDHLDALSESSHLGEITRRPPIRKLLEARMAAVCDTAEAGDETMFRLSEDKLLAEILAKARRMSENGLPKSMHDKFVAKPLEPPFILAAANSDSSSSSSDTPAESSSTPASSTPSSSTPSSTPATSATDPTPPQETSTESAAPEVLRLQCLRVAFDFICSGYVPPSAAADLKKRLAARTDLVDFAPLDEYLGRLAKLRQEAAAARSVADYAQKRPRGEVDDERADKKRRKEEEDKKKKAAETRGVRDLKKVDVSGMKKLSAFFQKK